MSDHDPIKAEIAGALGSQEPRARRRRMISIKLPPDLLQAARAAARAERRTLTSFIEAAIADRLERRRSTVSEPWTTDEHGRMAPLPGGSWGVVDLTLTDQERPDSRVDVELLCDSPIEAEQYVCQYPGRTNLRVAILSPAAVRLARADLRPTLGSVFVFDRSATMA